ncbi:MAG: hypothetical protein ACRD2N_04135 [Vicinamibacterales bacterium]
MHWTNDGLWFQGDAPRHAASGLFAWDLLHSLPTDPIGFTLSYYARYPIITPGAYPPLFYLLEGLAFSLTAPSPHVAKVLVLGFSIVAAMYTMMYGRRWISPAAGWAGACLVLAPGYALFSNTVLLNIPATALGLGALYHFRAWLDTSTTSQRNLFVGLTAGMLLTYYHAVVVVVPVLIAWMYLDARPYRLRALLLTTIAAIVLIALMGLTMPSYVTRHVLPIERFFAPWRWLALIQNHSSLTGVRWLVLGMCGILIGFVRTSRRKESLRLALAVALIGAAASVTVEDPRYGLMLMPITILAAFLGIVGVSELWKRAPSMVSATAVVVALGVAAPNAAARFPIVSGFETVAAFLRQQGAKDAVLYAGQYDGVFGFYLRASDPMLEQRLVLYRKLLESRPSGRTTPADVVTLIQSRCGCQWVAIEVAEGDRSGPSMSALRGALVGPEFELVSSFSVEAFEVQRVELYRVTMAVEPIRAFDLTFPLFSDRVFRNVSPIDSRR